MWRSSLFYGRKGLALNAISATDLALWDLLGKLRDEPVHALVGGAVREEIEFYATGPRPDLAREMGFVGGKLPLVHGPAEGEEGLRRNLEPAAEMRERVGDDFFLAHDCLAIAPGQEAWPSLTAGRPRRSSRLTRRGAVQLGPRTMEM